MYKVVARHPQSNSIAISLMTTVADLTYNWVVHAVVGGISIANYHDHIHISV